MVDSTTVSYLECSSNFFQIKFHDNVQYDGLIMLAEAMVCDDFSGIICQMSGEVI